MIERVGVQRVRTGGMITRNGMPRAEGVGRDALVSSYAFGTDAHFSQWEWALKKLVGSLERLGMTSRVVVNATPWALHDKHGDRARSESSMTPEWFNHHITRYWEAVEQRGIKVARVPQSDAIADPDHKWGPAYFHYMPTTYKAQLEAIAALI